MRELTKLDVKIAKARLDETDDECPLCNKFQYQGAELRQCIHCPWDASLPSDKNEAPEYYHE